MSNTDRTFDTEAQLMAATDALDMAGVEYSVTYSLTVKKSSKTGGGRPMEQSTLAVARALGTHRRKWCNTRDLAEIVNMDKKTISTKLSSLNEQGWTARREQTRNGCQYEYRLKDSYRREAGLVGGDE